MNVVRGMTLSTVKTGYSPVLDIGEGTAALIVVRTLKLLGTGPRISTYGELSLNGVDFGAIGAAPIFFVATGPSTGSGLVGNYPGVTGANGVPLAGRYFRLRFVLTGTGTTSVTFDADLSFKQF
jgi:hypothetical protein